MFQLNEQTLKEIFLKKMSGIVDKNSSVLSYRVYTFHAKFNIVYEICVILMEWGEKIPECLTL